MLLQSFFWDDCREIPQKIICCIWIAVDPDQRILLRKMKLCAFWTIHLKTPRILAIIRK